MDRDWKEDEEDVIFPYVSSAEKINATLDGDNKEEKDDVVDTFDNSNSKDVMFVYASNIEEDVSGEDQDTAMCYEDQARQESGEDQDTVVCYGDQARREDCTHYNVGINVEGRTEKKYTVLAIKVGENGSIFDFVTSVAETEVVNLNNEDLNVNEDDDEVVYDVSNSEEETNKNNVGVENNVNDISNNNKEEKTNGNGNENKNDFFDKVVEGCGDVETVYKKEDEEGDGDMGSVHKEEEREGGSNNVYVHRVKIKNENQFRSLVEDILYMLRWSRVEKWKGNYVSVIMNMFRQSTLPRWGEC